MVKKFDKEKTYIFSRERYIEVSEMVTESNGKEWYDRIDGVEVEVTSVNAGKCWDYLVLCSWCEEKDKSPKINLEVSQKEIELIIKSLDYLNNNDYFIEETESELAENLLKKLCKKSE